MRRTTEAFRIDMSDFSRSATLGHDNCGDLFKWTRISITRVGGSDAIVISPRQGAQKWPADSLRMGLFIDHYRGLN